MYLCYIDESGTPDIPGNTSHFVLSGISVPIEHWKDCDREIQKIKQKYSLRDAEIHVVSYPERKTFIKEIAQLVSGWDFARLFAECTDKIFFDPARTKQTVDEQSFEQIVSRFEKYLQNANKNHATPVYGLLIHDHNPTVSTRHTELMRKFHQKGTLWTTLKHIIETPLFVDSKLTSMVQVADLCSYALRRYLKNGEEELFGLIFARADQKDGVVVSVRHFTTPGCTCTICASRRKKP